MLLLRAVLDVVSNAFPHLQFCEPLALKIERELQPFNDVQGFEKLQLLTEVQFGRIARRVGQSTGSGDRPHERANSPVVAAQLENFVDDRPVFAFELSR